MCAICFNALQAVPVAAVGARALYVAKTPGWRRGRRGETSGLDEQDESAGVAELVPDPCLADGEG